jgi:scyllo-inositol 2-dehydrogenase (NADP+)
MVQPLRVGLVGYGYAGATIHAPLITAVDGLHLVRVASSQPEKVKLRGIEHTADATQLIEAPDLDLIVIATPNTTHFGLARQALLAGKHVVVEKPFTVTSAEGEELLQLARTQKRVLSVFHNRRWDSDFLTARHCIESGLLGGINTYHVHFDRYRPQVRNRWREQNLPGSGGLYDLGSHLIDQALLLFGRPRTVRAEIAIQRPNGPAADYFHLQLSYGSLKVVLHSGSLVREPGPRFQIHGSRGTFIKSGFDPQEEALKQGRQPNEEGWGREDATNAGSLLTERDGLTLSGPIATLPGDYPAFYRGMRDAIREGLAAPVSACDALQVIRVIELSLASERERRVMPFS